MSRSRIACLALVLASGCGPVGDVGEACETPAAQDECIDGAICEQTAAGERLCLPLCEEQADCETDESCNGVSDGSSLKACQPNDQP